jgi:L-lactate dehydrogenase complex protein LldG
VSGAREEILARIRVALRDVPGSERRPITRDYRRQADGDLGDRLERFAERVRDYHADVRQVEPGGIAAAVAQGCADMGLDRVIVPSEVPAGWRPDGVEVIEDEGLSAQAADAINGALTGCAVAIAETGTIVLDGRGVSGRRMITLVPDHHICVVRAEQVVGLVPEAITELQPAVVDHGSPITLVSGPSASSDIELQRVEGVHGPRHLMVFLVARSRTE